MAKIKCGECGVSMKDTYDNEIYKCNKCKMFLCPLHKQNHEEGHRIIKYEEINYTCDIHDEMYVSYQKKTIADGTSYDKIINDAVDD